MSNESVMSGTAAGFLPISDVLFELMIPLGRRWKSYSFPSTTTVCPALLPPWKPKPRHLYHAFGQCSHPFIHSNLLRTRNMTSSACNICFLLREGYRLQTARLLSCPPCPPLLLISPDMAATGGSSTEFTLAKTCPSHISSHPGYVTSNSPRGRGSPALLRAHAGVSVTTQSTQSTTGQLQRGLVNTRPAPRLRLPTLVCRAE